jgi:iron complex outermembrane recepter protein
MVKTIVRVATIGVFLAVLTTASRADTIQLPTFDIVATTPLNGGQINVSQVPFAVYQTTSQEMQTFNDVTLTDALGRSSPGVTIGTSAGSDFEPDLFFRGFEASGVSGVPQGLAVYQNGTRINEAFGDTVNWALIPANAIDTTTILTSNPIFGLNAIGGAVTVTMKNGFTWQGFEGQLEGGSFLRAQEQFQYGKQVGNYSVYVAASQINDGGWRVAGAQQLTSFYGDVGYKANGFESHLALTAGNNQFGVAAYTPIQMLQNNWGSVFTIPQTTYDQMAMLQWTGSYAYSPTLSFQGGAYFRGFNQQHIDGNASGLTPCPPSIGPFICLGPGPANSQFGTPIPDISQGGTLDLGEDDDNQTQSRSVGVSGQAVDTDKVFGRPNSLTVGTSLDYGWTHYIGDSQLGTITFTNDSFPVTPSPFKINAPPFLTPIDVRGNNTYAGVYALDTFDLSDRLTLTGGARFNFAAINLEGSTDSVLSGYSDYFHLNPTVGLTYKLTPDVSFYAGYAMTNRTPTPLELGCADPNHPCLIEDFLSSDPPLKQVVGNSFELGFRGTNAFSQLGLGPQWGKLQWSAGLYRTTLTNDILPIVNTFNGFGYYTNVGTTLRQGAEVSANWTGDRWSAYANYTYIDAIYLTTFQEPSPNNPLQNAQGTIPITNGTQLAGIPKNTVKVGVDYAVTPQWHVGGDMLAASGQVLFGNENNAVPQAPGYAIFGLHTSYQWNKQVQIYGYAQNIFDQRYYNSGSLFSTNLTTGPAPTLTNPQTFAPGKPVAIYGGIKITL